MLSHIWQSIHKSYLYYSYYIAERLPFVSRKQHQVIESELDAIIEEVETLKREAQRLEDMLANKNVAAIKAQTLYVTEHALDRYRKRIGFNGTDEELRKMIYKLTIRHLATMDYLPDGEYTINDKAMVRVKDNTVCTVVPYKPRRRS